MQVVAVRLCNLPRSDYRFLLEHISREARNRIERFVHAEDAHRTLIANILVRTLLCNRINCSNRELIFDKNEYGKPYLVGDHAFHYNLSHSEEWIVCAIDHSPIGIDVEMIKPIDLGICERFFSSIECEDLLDKLPNQRVAYFYDLWTLKESYIKAVGKGLSISLNSFAIRVLDNEIQLYVDGIRSYDYYFQQYRLSEEYQMAVCAEENGFSEQIEMLMWDDLLKKFILNCS